MSQVIILEGEYAAFVPCENRCRPCYCRVRAVPTLTNQMVIDKSLVFHGGKWHKLGELVGLDMRFLVAMYGFRRAKGSIYGRKSDV